MQFKNVLASSLVLMLVGLGYPMASAFDNTPSSNSLRISPSPVSGPSNNFAQPAYFNENIALRGHLATIPKGTIIMIKLDHPVSSTASKVGDSVSAIVEADVYLDNQIAIPAGSQVEGAITAANPAGHLGKHGSMEIMFNTIKTPNGYVLPMRAHVVTSDETGIIKGDSDQAQVYKTLGTAVGGAAAGTLMGTAAGSILGSAASGAGFGLAAGSIAGIGYAIVRTGKQVIIPSGARMSIILDHPIPIN
jgi:hypothetical protein